jgi:parallel beta-helix repeat protein
MWGERMSKVSAKGPVVRCCLACSVAAVSMILDVALATNQPALAATSIYQSAVLTDVPAAYYRLGESTGTTAFDSSPSNQPATFTGGVTLGAPGALRSDTDTAATFNGATAYVRDSANFQVGSDLTIEAWVKPASASVDAPVISLFGSGGARALYFQNGRFLGMGSLSSDWPTYTVTGQTVSANVWHHIVWTIQGGSRMTLYVDSLVSGSATVPAQPGFTAPLVIGWSDASWLKRFAGSVDEVAVYHAALSAARVQAHYIIGKSLPNSYVANVTTDSPLAYWRLDETTGATAADFSGHNFGAQLNGGITYVAAGALLTDPDQAMSLDGSTAYIRSPRTINVGEDFSIEAWVKPAASVDGPVVSVYGGGATRTLYVQRGHFIGMGNMGSSWPAYSVQSANVDSSQWHHVVFSVKEGTNLSLYVDGKLSASASVGALPGFSGTAVIGWSDATWLSRYQGSVDEVALYNSALPSSTVHAHYIAAVGSATPPGAATPTSRQTPMATPSSTPTTSPTFTLTPTATPIFTATASATAMVTPTRTNTPTPDCTTTLQLLVDAAPAGSSMTVPPCVYRESVTINKPLTLTGSPGSEIRGSDVWVAFASTGSTFVSLKTIPTLPTVSLDPNACEPSAGSRCLWPEQVFLDGSELSQQATGTTPLSGQFALDSSRHVVLADNPRGHVIEVTTRSNWIVTQSDGITIRRMTMRHAGNSAVAGAISNDGFSNWTLQDSIVSNAHGAVVRIDGGSNVKLLRNDISFGGLCGVGGSNVTQGGLVESNVIHANRTLEAGFSRAWGGAGLKLTDTHNLLVDGNDVFNNDGTGLWFDIRSGGVTIAGNRVHANRYQGITFEISNGAIVRDNAVWDNGWGNANWGWGAGIVISSSANAEVYGNTLAWNYADISIIALNRPDGVTPVGNSVHDNTVVRQTVTGDFSQTYWKNLSLAWLTDGTTAGAALYDPASNNRAWNNQFWYDLPENLSVRFSWTSQYLNITSFAATPGGSASSYLSTRDMTGRLQAAGIPTTP